MNSQNTYNLRRSNSTLTSPDELDSKVVQETVNNVIDGKGTPPSHDINVQKLALLLRQQQLKRHLNRHNTPFDGQIRKRKLEKAKRSRRANMDRVLRDK